MLTADEILAHRRQSTVLPVPEWGGDVRIQVMGGKDLIDYEAGAKDEDSLASRCARILAYTLVDEQGRRLFSEEQVANLFEMEGKVIVRLGMRATEINRLRVADMEDAEKKSDPSPGSSSSSASAWSWGSFIRTAWVLIRARSRTGLPTSAFFTRQNPHLQPHSGRDSSTS